MSSLWVSRPSCPAECVLAERLERRRGCVHEQLQGRQALLAIDDAARLQIPKDRLLCLNHDRTEEVPGIAGRLREPELRQPPDVLPQRRPLLVLLPDVRPLEQRHHQVLRLHEDILRSADVRFHQTAPPVYFSGAGSEGPPRERLITRSVA